MKKTTLLLFLWVFFMFTTISKIYIFPTWFLFLMFAFWVFSYYLRIHDENKKAKTPKPVYLAEPE